MDNIVKITRSAEETEKLAAFLSYSLKPGDIIGLVGDLGAGKTCFVNGLVSALQDEATISSPTYTLINVYDQGSPIIYHIDLYRLQSERELEEVGYDDYLYGKGITLIEWFDKISEHVPREYVKVTIEVNNTNMRTITFSGFGNRGKELINSLQEK
ncbi:tRNA (adenosine(37)-N6)-threonylcarbamoyltransferase complex ATPase subunit type 1 TsaE [Bdellovibrionota bacterium]